MGGNGAAGCADGLGLLIAVAVRVTDLVPACSDLTSGSSDGAEGGPARAV
jgi:hypothetical protein